MLWDLTRPDMELDGDGVDEAWGMRPVTSLTCVRGITIAPAPPIDAAVTPLREALARAVAALPDGVVALSGGVDSALVVALLHMSGRRLPLVTLRTGFAGYDEVEQAVAIARAFGDRVDIVDVKPNDYQAELAPVIEAVAQPLFNLHPVSRWLLVRALGATTLITGDGADQVFCGSPAAIYIPLVDAICRANRVTLASPFFAPEVGVLAGVDPLKQSLRALAAELGVPSSVAWARKTPRLTPHDAHIVRRQTLELFINRMRHA